MAFYLRKGFNFGPVRLNLSKSGVGVSGGMTGARAGLSPRGAYVHGGRGGVYYRKYARKGKMRSRSRNNTAKANTVGPSAVSHDSTDLNEVRGVQTGTGMVEVFVDTGVTWPSPIRIKKPEPFPAPDLPRTEGLLYGGLIPGAALLITGSLGLLGGVAVGIGFLLVAAGVGGHLFLSRKNSQAVDILMALREELARDEPNEGKLEALLIRMAVLRGTWRKWLDFHGGYHLEEAIAERPDQIPEKLIDRFERQTVLGRDELEKLHVALFQRRFEALAGDHILTLDDERHLHDLAGRLDLDQDQIGEELDTLAILSEIREESESFPDEIKAPVRLSKREPCYAAVPGRLLKEKVQQYRTIDRVRHKYVGYEIDMDGTLCLTDKRILIVADGSRSYHLSRILDVILSLEDATVRLVLDGRKTPVVLTMERPALFAARLQHLLEAQG